MASAQGRLIENPPSTPPRPLTLVRPGESSLLRHPIWVSLATLVVFGICWGLVIAREIVILGFLSLLIATLMSFPVQWLSKFMSRGLATLLTLLLFVCLGAGVVALVVPTLAVQFQQFSAQLPDATDRLGRWFEDMGLGSHLKETATKELGTVAKAVLPAAIGVTSSLFAVVLIFVLAAFLVHTPEQYRQGLKKLVSRAHEPHFDEIWNRLGTGLRHWVAGILVSMTIMGVLAGAGLALAGIQGAFMLGALTFFATFVPYVGAIASAIPGLLLGLAQSPAHFAYACVVYLVVHVVEGYVVEPIVMRRAVSIKPGLLLFWQSLLGGMLGILGIVIATPLLACVQIAVGYFYIEQKLEKRS